MRAVAADITERLGIVAIDLDPEHVEVGDFAQDFQIAFGLGVEIEIEQDIDIGPGAVANGFQMHAQVAQHLAVDIESRARTARQIRGASPAACPRHR